jgi:hypothetical protein
VRSDVADRSVCLRIREVNSAGATVGAAASCVKASTSWQQFAPVTYTTIGSANRIDVYASLDGAVAGDSFDLDGVDLH